MFIYMLKEMIMKYRVYGYELLVQHHVKKGAEMALRKERAKKRYERFKRKNKSEYRKLQKHINR